MISFFENLVLIFGNIWIFFIISIVLFSWYAIKFDMTAEMFLAFLIPFVLWFSIMFLPIWIWVLMIIGIVIFFIIKITRMVR
jgi:hypothetical protein